MATDRTIRYESSRFITDKNTLTTLSGALWDLHFNNNSITVSQSTNRTLKKDVNGTITEGVQASVVIDMRTDLANESTDRDTLATEVVNAGLDPDKSTAKSKINVR